MKKNNKAEFTAIIEPREILESQKKLEKKVKSELTFIGTRRVGFPGGHDDFEIWANERIWYGTQVVPDNIPHSRTRRVWNGFGLYGQLTDAQPNKLNITVEVNIPFELNRRISGLFARNNDSNELFLLHRGRLSGGRKGIGKTNFLNWYEENCRIKQIEVFEEDRKIMAYLVGNIDSNSFLENVVKFVARVAEFRNWATRT